MTTKVCSVCNQIEGIEEYDNQLWDVYDRAPDQSRHYIEPLVYTQSDFEDMGYHSMHDMDEEDVTAVKMSMENNMVERGLCPGCGRPDLSRIDLDNLLTDEEARDIHDMYAEMRAEQRMGA